LPAGTLLRSHPGTERRRQQNGHNHPSGDPGPSPEDIATTKQIMLAGKILCIPVLDHLIVTRNPHRYHSMFERGMLPTVPE
jgi:DNA repair protein RadC